MLIQAFGGAIAAQGASPEAAREAALQAVTQQIMRYHCAALSLHDVIERQQAARDAGRALGPITCADLYGIISLRTFTYSSQPRDALGIRTVAVVKPRDVVDPHTRGVRDPPPP